MKQITEDYVSYEIAKLLKEKGFSENTICKYAGVGGITEKWYDDYRERVLYFDWKVGYLIEPLMEPKDQYEIIGNTISAPTHQMALKWLREVHKIFVEPFVSIDLNGKYHYCFRLLNSICKDILEPKDLVKIDFKDTYEEAVEAALKYTLENLI